METITHRINTYIKSYDITYVRQRRVRRNEIVSELKSAISMATILDGYDTYIQLNKALSAIYDVPNDNKSLMAFWARVKSI